MMDQIILEGLKLLVVIILAVIAHSLTRAAHRKEFIRQIREYMETYGTLPPELHSSRLPSPDTTASGPSNS